MDASVFQLADDGKWYENAIIGEPKKWYIIWDETDPTTMIIRVMKAAPNRRYSAMQPYRQPSEIITEFKLAFSIGRKNANLDCRFPDARGRWVGKMLKAISYQVIQLGTIPASLIICFKDVYDKKPQLDGIFFSGSPTV